MNMRFRILVTLIFVFTFIASAQTRQTDYDIVIKNGSVYDGSGATPRRADVGIKADKIAAVGDLKSANAATVIDASGLAVAPGFINMLSWAVDDLVVDGRSLGDIKQGVTTEIFGEGDSMGPLNDEMKRRRLVAQGDLKFPIEWTTLAEYLRLLEKRGVSANVASYIGATTIREYVVGLEDKKATPEQMDQMRELVRREMEAGAIGIGSSLIYAPAVYSNTEELIEMCKVAAKYKGKYISHMRSEGNQLIEAVEELIRIAREAGIPAEIYHLKPAGRDNWGKMDEGSGMVNDGRRQGLKIRADMYTYPAGATGLDASLPPWAHDGGSEALYKRLQDPATRERMAKDVRTPTSEWENLYLAA